LKDRSEEKQRAFNKKCQTAINKVRGAWSSAFKGWDAQDILDCLHEHGSRFKKPFYEIRLNAIDKKTGGRKKRAGEKVIRDKKHHEYLKRRATTPDDN
jgi:hypothetical protein